MVGALRVTLVGVREDMTSSKAINAYAFSRGAPRKAACTMVATAQRKSQDFADDKLQDSVGLHMPPELALNVP
jgi:hypothetical protein